MLLLFFKVSVSIIFKWENVTVVVVCLSVLKVCLSRCDVCSTMKTFEWEEKLSSYGTQVAVKYT
eukprot:m.331608 g.331608  ORF g.331608 m.331608 type:complete len:64 (-) comp16762_c0_seq1:74-265(-)